MSAPASDALNSIHVMPGLVPGIHVFAHQKDRKTWMAGTSLDEPGHDDARIARAGEINPASR